MSLSSFARFSSQHSQGLLSKAFPLLFISGCLGALLCSPAAFAAEKDEAIPLKESIEAMLRNNNSLKAIQENRTAAGYEVDRAKAGYGVLASTLRQEEASESLPTALRVRTAIMRLLRILPHRSL